MTLRVTGRLFSLLPAAWLIGCGFLLGSCEAPNRLDVKSEPYSWAPDPKLSYEQFTAIERQERLSPANQPPRAIVPAPTFVTEKGVTFDPSDASVRQFLALAISCGEFEATMRNFLQQRSSQAKSYGIDQTYTLTATDLGTGAAVYLVEDTRRRSGQPLSAIPPRVEYVYSLDWSGARFVQASDGAISAHPVAFFQMNGTAVCNGARARQARAE